MLFNWLRLHALCVKGLVLLHEIRVGARTLLRVPSLTGISILTIALGVGTGTALFSVVKAVLLNPLPYPDPGRLAWLAEINDKGQIKRVAYQNFLDWREQNRAFAAMAATEEGPGVVAGGELPQSSYGALVTSDFFPLCGVSPALGRTFAQTYNCGTWQTARRMICFVFLSAAPVLCRGAAIVILVLHKNPFAAIVEGNRFTSPCSSTQVNAVIGPTAGMLISRFTRSVNSGSRFSDLTSAASVLRSRTMFSRLSRSRGRSHSSMSLVLVSS